MQGPPGRIFVAVVGPTIASDQSEGVYSGVTPPSRLQHRTSDSGVDAAKASLRLADGRALEALEMYLLR